MGHLNKNQCVHSSVRDVLLRPKIVVLASHFWSCMSASL